LSIIDNQKGLPCGQAFCAIYILFEMLYDEAKREDFGGRFL
jgi:hypothetical protein